MTSSKRLDTADFGHLKSSSPEGNSIESRKLTRAPWTTLSAHKLLVHLCAVTNVKYTSFGEKGFVSPVMDAIVWRCLPQISSGAGVST